MSTAAPIQQRVTDSQAKVAALMSELQGLLPLAPTTPSPVAAAATRKMILKAPAPAPVKPAGAAATKKGEKKAAPAKKQISVEGRIKLARTAAEMQARRKGWAPRLVKKAGEAAAARKSAELNA